MKRSLNEGFSGGEKKRNEVFQMLMLEPNLALLDETDSGLDVDALKSVGDVVNRMRNKSSTIKNKSLSTRNLFSDKIGKTIIRTDMVGVIKNKDVLFLNSKLVSFFTMYFLII